MQHAARPTLSAADHIRTVVSVDEENIPFTVPTQVGRAPRKWSVERPSIGDDGTVPEILLYPTAYPHMSERG